MSHRCSLEELALTRGFSESPTNAFCTGMAFCYCPGCSMWSQIERRQEQALTMTESMGDWTGSFTSCSWPPNYLLSEVGTILASHPGQTSSVRGWWCTLLGSWHLSCILSAPIWQRGTAWIPSATPFPTPHAVGKQCHLKSQVGGNNIIISLDFWLLECHPYPDVKMEWMEVSSILSLFMLWEH